jgi:hypothetical protein
MNIFLIFMLAYFKIFQRLINLTDLDLVLFLNRVIEFIRAIMVHMNLLSWFLAHGEIPQLVLSEQ